MTLLIRAAAIRTRRLGIIEGLNHNTIRVQAGGITGEEGFILTDGRFVGRLQAAAIAVNAGQAPSSVLYQITGLSSSDLTNNYPPEEPAPTETK